MKALSKEAQQATAKLQRAVEFAIEELAALKEQAVKEVVGAAKDTAANFPPTGGPDTPATQKARQAAARVIKMLAQASENITLSANNAAARLQQASEEAITSVREASIEAEISVHEAIGAANVKILNVTKTAVGKTVGDENVQIYNLESLRDKWNKRRF